MAKNNPAEQLLNILKEFPEQATKPNEIALNIWSRVLDAGAYDFPARFAQFQLLIDDVCRLIEADNAIENKAIYLAWKSPLLQLLNTTSLLDNGPKFNNKFNKESIIMHTLTFCSEALSKSFGTEDIEEESINKLSELVEQLHQISKEEVKNPQLRIIILELIESIRETIRLYEIRGIQGIQEALERLAGSMLFHQKLFESEAERTPKTLEKILNILKHGYETLKTAGAIGCALENSEKLIKYLPFLKG